MILFAVQMIRWTSSGAFSGAAAMPWTSSAVLPGTSRCGRPPTSVPATVPPATLAIVVCGAYGTIEPSGCLRKTGPS